jgi:hypothetical protein
MTNFLLNVTQASNYQYSDNKTDKKAQSTTAGFNKIDMCLITCVGIAYEVKDKIHLIAEPTFRYGMIETKDVPVTEKLWSGGVYIGFYYALR